MFLKIKDGSFIPFIESGDNNVWEVGRNRRSRSWESCRWTFEDDERKNRISLTEDEILGAAQEEINRGGNDCIKLSGHSGWGTPAQFLSFFRSGFRHAVTFDDLRRESCFVTLGYWKDGNYSAEYATSEEELLRKWDEFLSLGIRPYVGLGLYSEHVWTVMKRNTNRRIQRNYRNSSSTFVVVFSYCGNTRYAQKLTSRHLNITDSCKHAFRYASLRSAEATAAKISGKYGKSVSDVRVEQFSSCTNS